MPLLDHFHPPLSDERGWRGFHSKWANVLVDELNETLLPDGYFAEPQTDKGLPVEIDVATREHGNGATSGGAATATVPARIWSPPAPTLTMPTAFVETFEVQVFNTEEGPRLVAAIELVSPRNKDRAEARRAFAVKCASYLAQAISLIVVDVVTNRQANLHDEIVGLMPSGAAFAFPGTPRLYASAYQPILREEQEQLDAWLHPLAVGQELPTLPLALTAEIVLPINLETTYLEACRKLRLP
jgi:hypothetical protein